MKLPRDVSVRSTRGGEAAVVTEIRHGTLLASRRRHVLRAPLQDSPVGGALRSGPEHDVNRGILVLRMVVPVGLAAVLLGSCTARPHALPRDPPDVVLIVIDTFRPDHLGFNGYGRQTAPFLEGLMARSAVFQRAYSTSSWTAPATGSLFTSLYPTRHGVTEGFLAHRHRADAPRDPEGATIRLGRLPAGVATLPELLQRAGYRTFGLASNINVGREIGFDRGFDRFQALPDRSAETLAEELLSWRGELVGAEPRLVYLHFNDPHLPYQARAPWFVDSRDELERSASAYDSEISYLDQVLERLYRELAWDRDTLLVVVSDHGEEFRDHGQTGHPFTLYDELLRVLLVVAGEDLGIRPATLDVDASLIDVAPTILELVGAATPADRDGRSLAPWLAGSTAAASDPASSPRTLFAHRQRNRERIGRSPQHLWAALRGPWKLVVEPDRDHLLFHRERDPRERVNVAAQHPEVVAELARELGLLRADGMRRGHESIDVAVDREKLEALEALGYVE
jgi:arylsulfatase A-like enzyme